MLTSAQALRSRASRTLRATSLRSLKTKKEGSEAPLASPHRLKPSRAKTMCRQKLRNEVPAARQLALSCLPNRASKVDSRLRFFAISLNKQHSLPRCFDCEQRWPSARSRLAFSRRGPCVPSRSALGPSHALHQVCKQGFPSSPALSSRKGGSRQEIADIPRFAAPPGDAHRARGSLIFAPPQHAGCNTSVNLSCSCSNYCAGFNRNRRVTLAPKPT
jgi:hypothetical protein